jgi:DNA-binding transcriptional MerR regulator
VKEERRWSLEELVQESRKHLSSEGDSSRVQWRPNGRQIRYYTTLGLMDRPFGGRGYGSEYGPKHLLQLLAIKHLQHQGLSLARVQAALHGLNAKQLLQRLGLSPEWYAELGQPAPPPPADRRQADFWSRPAPVNSPVPRASCRCHFELGGGASLVVEQDVLERLPPRLQSELIDDLAEVWRRYIQESRQCG